MKKRLVVLSLAAGFGLLAPGGMEAAEVNWGSVQSHKVKLFYPGVASWEFLNSADHSLGAKNIKEGKKSCAKCHRYETGEYDIMANEIAAGKFLMKKSQKPFEPEPIAGKKGFMEATMQPAYDGENFYLRIEWKSKGASFNDPALAKKGMADRVMAEVNKGNDYFRKYGCFIACHNDVNHMPESPSSDEVKKHPYYSAINRDTVNLYAFYTRTDGWKEIRAAGEIEELSKTGLIDLWKVEFEGKEVKANDMWILEDRRNDEKSNIDAEGRWEEGKYSVVIKRRLKTGDTRDVQFEEGDVFTFAISIHDDGAGNRRHYVGFPIQIGLGGGGDITAKKVK